MVRVHIQEVGSDHSDIHEWWTAAWKTWGSIWRYQLHKLQEHWTKASIFYAAKYDTISLSMSFTNRNDSPSLVCKGCIDDNAWMTTCIENGNFGWILRRSRYITWRTLFISADCYSRLSSLRAHSSLLIIFDGLAQASSQTFRFTWVLRTFLSVTCSSSGSWLFSAVPDKTLVLLLTVLILAEHLRLLDAQCPEISPFLSTVLFCT